MLHCNGTVKAETIDHGIGDGLGNRATLVIGTLQPINVRICEHCFVRLIILAGSGQDYSQALLGQLYFHAVARALVGSIGHSRLLANKMLVKGATAVST